HPRVEQAERDVDGQVDDDGDGAQNQDDALHRRVVAAEDGLDDLGPQPADVEDVLGDDGASEESDEQQAAEGQRARDHVGEDVPVMYSGIAPTSDVTAVKGLVNARPRLPCSSTPAVMPKMKPRISTSTSALTASCAVSGSRWASIWETGCWLTKLEPRSPENR